MLLTVAHDFLPKTPTLRTTAVMGHFGIDFEQGRHALADDLPLDVRPGEVVSFEGPSGSGKSSLMRAAAATLAKEAHVVNVDDLDLGDRPLVDALPGTVEEAMRLLGGCGLGEAHLMLRTPAELSEGQRYRFRLALALSRRPDWVVADEFTATLDRTLARVVAGGVRRAASRDGGSGFLIATTHDDVWGDLRPDVRVRCDLGGDVSVTRPGDEPDADGSKKKADCSTSSGSVKPPRPTGRTSLGGITAATRSACYGS